MKRADQLQIGDYVLVSGTPRRVESITKKKIGYHINPQTNKRLYYARLHDVEPIEITEVFVEDPKNVILNRIYKIHADGWMCGDRNKVSVDFAEGDAGFYTPFYLHDLFHVIKAGIDNTATLSIVKTYEERREEIDKVDVSEMTISQLAEYLCVHYKHAVIYPNPGNRNPLFAIKDGEIRYKSDDYDLWKENRFVIIEYNSDWVETFKIKIIVENE